jgi:hypothetical protein
MLELSMENYVDILEHELESAVEVKDKASLHRVVQLIAENTVGKREYSNDIGELKSDVRLIVERMDQGFKRMDERFADMASRFRMMFTFITIGFTVLTSVIVLIKFLA